jgi:hypothetical protein
MDTRERLLVDDLLMRKVDEVNYLVAENASLYRPIVRFFHQRYESGETGWLWPGEVAEFVRGSHPHHREYRDEACEAHLRQLEAWGVLDSEQDVNQARTIEETYSAAAIDGSWNSNTNSCRNRWAARKNRRIYLLSILRGLRPHR